MMMMMMMIMIIIMISIAIFCFHIFRSVITAQGVICNPQVRKGVIKLQQIIIKHKQAFILTPIYYQKNTKKDIFGLAILGMFVLHKLLCDS